MTTYPKLIKELDYETILATHLENARDIAGWSAELESDPVLKLIEGSAYRELVLRAHINHTAISNLIYFATESDLDACAGFYQIARVEGEGDDRFRARLFDGIKALAGNGTTEHYRFRAMSASLLIDSVNVTSPKGGVVDVALWLDTSAINDLVLAKNPQNDDEYQAIFEGIKQDVIAAAKASLTKADEQILGVLVNVFEVEIVEIDITATIIPDSRAPANLCKQASDNIISESVRNQGFDESLSLSMIVSWCHIDYVDKVELIAPTKDFTPEDHQVWQVGRITLNGDIYAGDV